MESLEKLRVSDGAPRPQAVRQRNISAIVRTILANGPTARKEIAQLTGLSAGSVSRVTAELLSSGLLLELPSESTPGNAGAPRVPLDLSRQRYMVLGVHIGALRTTLGLVDIRGSAITIEPYDHEGTSPTVVLDRAADLISDFIARHGHDKKIIGVGVTLAGRIDPAAGVVIEHDTLGWRDVSVREHLADRVPVPVLVESSVRARALAELWSGAARAVNSLAYLFVGTVVDAAIVIDRHVHNGPRSAAGTIGHFHLVGRDTACDCGRHGCVQAQISDLAAIRQAHERGIADVPTIQALVDRARAGERSARAVLLERAEQVGETAAMLLDLIDPEIVVFSDNAVTETPGYVDAVRRGAAARIHTFVNTDSVIVPSAFAEQAIVIAPATRLLDAFYDDPHRFLGIAGTEVEVFL